MPPAQCGETGMMTFIVNNNGAVNQKNTARRQSH
ncbi:DUF2950 family protein [Caballeronia grimmiae]